MGKIYFIEEQIALVLRQHERGAAVAILTCEHDWT